MNAWKICSYGLLCLLIAIVLSIIIYSILEMSALADKTVEICNPYENTCEHYLCQIKFGGNSQVTKEGLKDQYYECELLKKLDQFPGSKK